MAHIFLKALTFATTGWIVAAPTTSLPEQIGGVRNWDYRHCWLRDATLTLLAFLNAGYLDEAAAWRVWLLRAVAGDPADLQIMYGLAGERRLPELELPWLSGYEGSKPVRTGNAATEQLQLDAPRREPPHHPARRVPARRRPANDRHRRSDPAQPRPRRLRAALRRRRRGGLGGRPAAWRGRLPPVHVLARGQLRAPGAARRGPRALRAAARSPERARPARRGVRPRPAPPARQLPAGVHACRPREHSVQPRPGLAPEPDRPTPAGGAARLALSLSHSCGGRHEAEVAEALREVAEELTRPRIELLGEEPEVVRKADQLVHRLAGLRDAARTRERLHEPERARHEGALHLLLAAVAVEERAARSELAADRLDRPSHELALRVDEAGPRRPQRRRVELVGVGVEGEAPVAGGETARLDELADRLPLLVPLVGV